MQISKLKFARFPASCNRRCNRSHATVCPPPPLSARHTVVEWGATRVVNGAYPLPPQPRAALALRGVQFAVRCSAVQRRAHTAHTPIHFAAASQDWQLNFVLTEAWNRPGRAERSAALHTLVARWFAFRYFRPTVSHRSASANCEQFRACIMRAAIACNPSIN